MTEKEIHIEQLMLEELSGTIGEEDSRYLKGLLASEKEISRKWEKLKEEVEDESCSQIKDTDEEEAWNRVKEGILVKKHRRVRRTRTWTVAASVLVLLCAAGFLFYPDRTQEGLVRSKQQNKEVKLRIGGTKTIDLSKYGSAAKPPPALNNVNLNVGKGNLSYVPVDEPVNHALNTLVIPATKTYSITLSDGTEVTLNSMTKLKFPFVFSGDKREVWLEGEAYFKVAKDETHPFVVHTSLTEIDVLGTAFNVNTYDSLLVRTALIEGSVVAKAKDGKKVKLRPGHEAVFSPGNGFSVSTLDNKNTLSWMNGIYYFQNTPLKRILPVIRRWYGDSIIFDNIKASSNRFTGALLKDKPLKEFLENLSLTSKVRYYKQDGLFHISTE